MDISEDPSLTWRDAPQAEFAVIGFPVSHSRSPDMQNATLAAIGSSERYVAIEVAPGEVAIALDELRDRGYIGVNVTVPHKSEAATWCETVEPFAHRADAVNTVRLADKCGRNTDGPGFLRTLPPGFQDREVLLLGAGGSARAIALALAGVGARLRIWNRTPERAAALADECGAIHTFTPVIDAAEIVINATSASLAADSLAVDWETACAAGLAIDLMYGANATAFLAGAVAAGWQAQDGRSLLVEQGAIAMEWWRQQSIPREPMRRVLGL